MMALEPMKRMMMGFNNNCNTPNTIGIRVHLIKMLFIVCCFFITSSSLAQKNIVKGRVGIFPLGHKIYSLGIGYERVVSDRISLQLLYNSYGGTFGLDGPSKYYQGIVPEVRYYFGKKESLRRKVFIGGFTEIYKAKLYPGMIEPSLNDYLIETNGISINPGVLIGKNISLGKRFLFDIYVGYRYKIFNGEQNYRDVDTLGTYNKKYQEGKSGIRIGLNLGIAF